MRVNFRSNFFKNLGEWVGGLVEAWSTLQEEYILMLGQEIKLV
jgi:hypothetical protein